MKNNKFDIYILKYLSEELSDSDMLWFKKQLLKSEENRKLFKDMRKIWLSVGMEQNADDYDIDEAINKFKSRIEEDKKKSNKQFQMPVLNAKMTSFLRLTAVIICFVALSVTTYFIGKQSDSGSQPITVSCDLGDRSKVILPDGSKVWINSGSKIIYNNANTEGNRIVELSGEGYFEVVKNKEQPFIVKSGINEVVVLGTSFNVKAYHDDENIETSLIEGSVEIRNINSKNKKSVLLIPGEQAIFSKKNKLMKVSKIEDLDSVFAWKNGKLKFINERLETLIPKLERWYNAEIQIEREELNDLRFTGTIEHERIEDVLQFFKTSSNTSYKIKNDVIILY
jgi:ferric-dicitrate binding protein FerR (iron transport regulator)